MQGQDEQGNTYTVTPHAMSWTEAGDVVGEFVPGAGIVGRGLDFLFGDDEDDQMQAPPGGNPGAMPGIPSFPGGGMTPIGGQNAQTQGQAPLPSASGRAHYAGGSDVSAIGQGWDPAPDVQFAGPDPTLSGANVMQWVAQIVQVLQRYPGIARKLAQKFNFVRNEASDMSPAMARCLAEELPHTFRKVLYQYMSGLESPMGFKGTEQELAGHVWVCLSLAESGMSEQLCNPHCK